MTASPDEIDRIWVEYVATRSPALQELLVVHYEPLARYLARRALAKAPAYQDAEDILSYAHHGLLNAIERFEPAKGFKFETYATRRISGAIIDGQRRQDPLGRQVRKRVKTMTAAQDALWNELGREPTLEEVAAAAGETSDAIRELLVAQQSVAGSLDESDDDDSRQEHVVTSLIEPDDAEIERQVGEIRDGVSERLANLGVRERTFALLHYVRRLTLSEVGDELGVSEARCGQLRQDLVEAITGGRQRRK